MSTKKLLFIAPLLMTLALVGVGSAGAQTPDEITTNQDFVVMCNPSGCGQYVDGVLVTTTSAEDAAALNANTVSGNMDTTGTTGLSGSATMANETATTGTGTPLLPNTGAGGEAGVYLTVLAATLAMIGGGILALRGKMV